ncbi:BTB/POZ protein [Xylogone sp. PMI_703]|nr:BTB/POZ protein [Xylogone sp. PMI_703]
MYTPNSPLPLLLSSAEYSDLTLKCQGEIFKVHKAVVCFQSPVLAAALRGDFKEAKTNMIDIASFDVRTTRCMVEFMYTGDYQIRKSKMRTDEDLQAIEKKFPFLLGESDKDDADSQLAATSRDENTLLDHVHVHAIAEYYDISQLKQLSTSKIQLLLKVDWSADEFQDAVKEVLNWTRDRPLQN